MSAWIYFAPSDFGAEEDPIDAGQMKDIVRGNTQAAIDEHAHFPFWPIINTPLTTTSATYTDGSCLVRLPPYPVPSADSPLVVVHFKFRLWGKVSSAAQDGTLRVAACKDFRIPADAADADFLVAESSIIESTTYVEREVTLSLTRHFTSPTTDGQAPDEPESPYRITHFCIQGKITGGATLTLGAMGELAVNP